MTETRVIPLSLAERDRRWANIRAEIESRGLDALLIRGISTKWDSGTANVRYISQIGGNGEEAMAIFPAKGDPVVFVWAPSQLKWWPIAQDWVKDIRLGNPSWAMTSTDCLKEMGHEKGRIGVVGIEGSGEAGKCMSHDIYKGIREALPEAQFEPASDILEKLRLNKSQEEIEFLAKATELCDVGVKAMLEIARPGVTNYEVYGEIVGATLKAGGESPMFLMYEADPEPVHALRFPSDRTLAPGYKIIQEIAPKYAGYWSQVMVPVCLGEPDAEYRALVEAACQACDEAVKAIRPGISMKQLAEMMNRPIVEAGFTWTRPQWQGLGLEQSEAPTDWSFPNALGEAGQGPADLLLEEGMVLGLQPMAAKADHSRGTSVGDAVAVTKEGARKLGKTKMQLYVV